MKLKSTIKKIIPKKRVKVNLFIVGAQKAGTSALHNYLCQHPRVIGGKNKEINFFNHNKKYSKGTQWYHRQFKKPFFWEENKLYLDSTPQYLSEKDIAHKIYQYNPKAKIIILLRNPVSRAYSGWNMYRQFSQMTNTQKEKLLERHISYEKKEKFLELINLSPFPSFEYFIDNELNGNVIHDCYPNIVKRGIYYDQVKRYMDVYDLDNIEIIESDEFKNNKLHFTNKILKQNGLKIFQEDDSTLAPVHNRTYEKKINSRTKEKLEQFYKPYNEKLFELIDQRFNW